MNVQTQYPHGALIIGYKCHWCGRGSRITFVARPNGDVPVDTLYCQCNGMAMKREQVEVVPAEKPHA